MKRVRIELGYGLRGGILLALLLALVIGVAVCPRVVLGFSGAGSGTEEDPYIISDATELQEMKNDLDAHYELGNDIDASATSGWNGNLGFLPVGNSTAAFNGTLDGKGYMVTDLFIKRTTKRIGLFGNIVSATIQNVALSDCNVTGDDYVGSLIGYMGSGTVTNCAVSGIVVGNDYVGGLIGYVNGGTVQDSFSWADIDVTDSASNGGGLVGYFWDGTVQRCYATGDVSTDELGGYLGGLVGYQHYGTTQQCFATGDVLDTGASAYEVGGLVGMAQYSGTATKAGYILNCYATGSVNNTIGDGTAGGLVGGVAQKMVVENCYSTGVVSGKYKGGLIGDTFELETGALNCYWDIDTSGMNTSAGGQGAKGVVTCAFPLECTFYPEYSGEENWDFINIWKHTIGVNPILDPVEAGCEGTYPCLREVTPGCCNSGNGNGNGYGYTPIWLLALPVSSTEISLTWEMGENATETRVVGKTGGWPTYYNDANATVVYEGSAEIASHSGLNPGTTYYYRAWGKEGDSYSANYTEDMATTLMGSVPCDPSLEEPPWWFQTPTCTAYKSMPWFPMFQSLAGSYDLPEVTGCLILTIVLLIAVGIVTQTMAHNALVTLGTVGVGMVAASIAGLLPLWMILVTVVAGGAIVFVWSRA